MWRLPTLLSIAVLVEGDVTTFDPDGKSKIKIPDNFAKCGCVWSEREGCTTSAEQVSEALADSEITETCEKTGGEGLVNSTGNVWDDPKVVQARARKECEVRSRIKEYRPHIEQCASLDATGCKEQENYCQYNAQGKNQCGIDMEKLMKKVAGPEKQNHPLMKLVIKADHCATLGHNVCDTYNECDFDEETGCGLSTKEAFTTILGHPQVLGMLLLINLGSQCRANYEHGTGKCPRVCQMESGVCTTDPRKSQSAQVSHLVDALCQSAYEHNSKDEGGAKKCPQPCTWGTRRDMHDGRDGTDGEKVCKASESPSNEAPLSENDVFICQSYSVVHSTLIAYERHCNMMDYEKAMCEASEKVCPEKLNDAWSLTGGKDQGDEDPAPGLTGILGEIAALVDQNTGPVVDFFQKYLEKNPSHIKELLTAASSASHHLDFEPGENEPGDSVSRVEQTTPGPRPAGKSARDFFSDQYWFGSKSNPDTTSHWLLFVAGILSAGALYASFKFGVSLNQWIPCLAPASALSAPLDVDDSDLEG